MADYDPFGERESRPEEPMDEDIRLNTIRRRFAATAQVHAESGEQETSFDWFAKIGRRA